MEDILDLLVKIQYLHEEIKENDLRLNETPNKITNLEQDIEKKNANLNQKKNRIQEIKKICKMKDGDITENESKIDKLNQQIFSVKTNEEYRAITNEIEYLKKTNKGIEDEILSLLEEEEEIKDVLVELEKETKDFFNQKKSEIDTLKKYNEKLMEKQQMTKFMFEDNIKKLPNDIKNIYERIAKARGRAVCIIRGNDYVCTGCFTNITPQVMNELKKRDKILLCDNCGCILIYDISGK